MPIFCYISQGEVTDEYRMPVDHNLSPPSLRREEEEVAPGGDPVGSTVYTSHWLFRVLTRCYG